MPTQNSGLVPSSSPLSASLTSSLTLRQSATVVQSGFSHRTCNLLPLLLFLAAANRSSKSCTEIVSLGCVKTMNHATYTF